MKKATEKEINMPRPEAMEALPYLERKWWAGRPAEIWISQISIIEKIINKYKLRQLDNSHFPAMAARSEMAVNNSLAKSAKKPVFDPRPFPGGLRQPHIHFKSDIYILNRKQWQDFSSQVMNDLRKNLEQANTVGFEKLVELEEVVGSIM